MNLPRALAPWSEALSFLPRDLALSLRHPLQQLAVALPDTRGARKSPMGDPDGFDGITSRGPLHRLLLSEWALADAHPREFIRRAAMAEQSYLQLGYVQPPATQRIVVLTDTGPSQHGAPRVAHLALLILLAARAQRTGAAFAWAPIHHTELQEGFGRDGWRTWSRSASWHTASAAHVSRWKQTLCPEEADDVWLIGGPTLRDLPVDWPRVQVSQPLAVPPVLDVRIQHHRRRTLQLTLPADDDCAGLLLGPRSTSEDTSQTGIWTYEQEVGTGPMWFSPDGKHLVVIDALGALAVPVPSSPVAARHTVAPRLERLRNPHLLAVNFDGQQFISVSRPRPASKTLQITHGSRHRIPDPGLELFEPTPAFVLDDQVLLLDDEARLWSSACDTPRHEEVVSLDARGFVWCAADAVHHEGHADPGLGRLEGQYQQVLTSAHWVALQLLDDSWMLRHRRSSHVRRIGPTTHAAVGIVELEGQEPQLILADEGDHHIYMTAPRGEVVVGVSGTPLCAVAVSPTQPVFAWRAVDHGVTVRALPGRERLVRVVAS